MGFFSLSVQLSVVVANYNGAAHLDACLASLTRQTLDDLEIIVVDDASTDDSVAVISAWVRRDSRIKLLSNQGKKGPAGARNTGLAVAIGEWIGVVDSDDMVFARRFEQLIARAQADGADIAADDLLVFNDDDHRAWRFLKGARRSQPTWVTAEDYLDENHMYSGTPNLGILKPVIRRGLLEATRYDEDLRIAEDFDLILRLLCAGARFRVYPDIHYLYRKHSASISHVLKGGDIERMKQSHTALAARITDLPAALRRAFERRYASLQTAAAFDDLITALKARSLAGAVRVALKNPAAAALLRLPVQARIDRLFAARPAAPPARPSCCLISRQRIVGPTNGSSTYVLAIARAIRESGMDVHLLQPSPSLFGRQPVLALQPEMQVFSSILMRGAVALGRYRIVLNPAVFLAAARTILGRLAERFGWKPAFLQVQPAPYAIGGAWTNEDLLHVARHAPRLADLVVFDYAFQTVASPYVLRDRPLRLTIMHDLFSSRDSQFAALGASDSVHTLGPAQEMRLLSGGDVTLAIQKEEAAHVAERLPHHRVLTAMMPVEPVAKAQPGEVDTLLFVGSNAAPNVDGLRWFIDEALPKVLARRPQVRVLVAGSVARDVHDVPPAVQMLGIVPDLAPLYARAAVVLSPLRAGSGLKIKLVEALAQGKAIVATSTTLQGISEETGDAVRVADTSDAFANAIVDLLEDADRRQALAEAALAAAATHFSFEACMGALQATVAEALAPAARRQPLDR